MQLDLPPPIAAYLAAHGRRSDGIADLFVQDAVVKDEGHSYLGVAAISRWLTESSAKYDFTVQPIAGETADGATIVTCRVTGNFPGSPVDLRYRFRVDGDKIASLEITP
ncbi:nuclear transport factor 2 family protein [Rhodopseudomonas palustris]|uniref:nuclear transport factor 2 family protein n=1 Tax=Rhodopseudomonas palustris TaxID=1076 RepID=UPI002ACDCC3D|nr:nuclear transport factor 2 family protein [Rhodopseudomonas palustris]WQG98828.1 nuclear transport factor 2 family protein [Rhodopseudomonas palustris]